jgi:hypothetical protein
MSSLSATKSHVLLTNDEMIFKLLCNSDGKPKSDLKYEYTFARVVAAVERMKPENKTLKFVETVNALIDDKNPDSHRRADTIFGLNNLPEEDWDFCLRRK